MTLTYLKTLNPEWVEIFQENTNYYQLDEILVEQYYL